MIAQHAIDFYKVGHRVQYPKGTNRVVSNFTPRSSKHASELVKQANGIVFFGLQYLMKHYLQNAWHDDFFGQPKDAVLKQYRRRMFNAIGNDRVDHLAALHDLGYLPIEIKALPEGTLVPIGTPCLSIHNTQDEFYWLTNYLETILSSYLWMPCTSATTARVYRKILEDACKTTGGDLAGVDYQAHDFSFRGMPGPEAAALSGAAHLLFFRGTDTIPAIDLLEEYYETDAEEELVGCSVPATEHSVMSMGGKDIGELDTFRRLITKTYPNGIISIVSDTWDFWQVINTYSRLLKAEIMGREGKVVFRPDSGDPVKIICGDPDADPGSCQYRGAVEVLHSIFGGEYTTSFHQTLDPHVGLIYGDSITPARAQEICERLRDKGFASSNVVFGVGSYTYQHVTRDTWGFAMKATYGEVDGQGRDIYKDPVTDDGVKKSHRGLLCVNKDLSVTQGVNWGDFIDLDTNQLRPVFHEGTILEPTTLAEIRSRVAL